MSTTQRWILCLILLFMSTSAIKAGLYWPAEQHNEKLHKKYALFRDTFLKYKLVRFVDPAQQSTGVQEALASKYLMVQLATANRLAPLANLDTMTERDFLNVSAYLCHLQRYNEAIIVLKKGIKDFEDNFLLRANLGTAYHLAAEQERDRYKFTLALLHLKKTKAAWKENPADLTPEQFQFCQKLGWLDGATPQLAASVSALMGGPFGVHSLSASASLDPLQMAAKYKFYRMVEEYYYKLVKSRLQNMGQDDNVDPIFTNDRGEPLYLGGPNDRFQPGKLAKSEREKLPHGSLKKAILIVEQLLIWMPQDNRLYWLLGELVNGQGDIKHAREIYRTLIVSDARYAGLMKHSPMLKFLNADTAKKESGSESIKPGTASGKDKQTTVQKNDNPSNTVFSWQPFVVGFACGIIVAVLGYWQIREIHRRRQRRALHSQHSR